MNYYRRYIGDYGRKTALLSLMEHGAYCVLLDHYYAEECPLPVDREDIYRLARAVKPEERKAVDKVLARYFVEKPDGFHNERADDELVRAAPAIKAAKENGGKGGRPRKSDNPTGLEEETQGETHRDSYAENPPGSENTSETEPTGIAIRAGDPTTNHHTPTSNHQPPAPNHHKVKTVEPRRIKRANGSPAKSAVVFEAYAAAYKQRYHVEPVRNAKGNALLCHLVDRLGAEEAPAIAAFYVAHNSALYVRGKHPVDLLIRDAEGLRTEWATGKRVTETEARQADRTQATGDVFGKLIEEAAR